MVNRIVFLKRIAFHFFLKKFFTFFLVITLQHTHAADRIYALARFLILLLFYSLYYFGDYRIEYVLMAEVLDTRKWE